MKKIFLLPVLLFLGWSVNAQVNVRVWHVSGTGNDSNKGTLANPFRTLQKAAEVVKPGDTVLIANGIYTSNNVADGGAVVTLSSSGTPDAWITWKARPGHRPEIRPIGWAGIQITGSYHVIDGLTVTGGNDYVTLAAAIEDSKKTKADPKYNTNGIIVEGRNRTPDEKPHHIVIRNCTVGKCPGGGITMLETDYVTIQNCKVYDNAWYMRYAGSGITFLNSWAFDSKPGYHIIIQNNMVWNNKTMVPWDRTGKLSDGNGILLDVTDQAQGATNPNGDAVVDTAAKKKIVAKPKRPEWNNKALIANNLSAYNGGSGIHTFRTKNVDIINNTTYWNGQTVGYEELFANRSENIVILNNIMVPRPGGKVTSNNRNTNVRWDYNLYPQEQTVMKGEHDIVADPQFINAQLNIIKGNFKLSAGSRALNTGTKELLQAKDIGGKKRPQGKGVDRGCYEQQ